MMDASFSENSSLASEEADSVGAYTLTRVMGPSVVLRRRARSRSEPPLPGSTIRSKLFFTAKPTPRSLDSSERFSC